MTTIIGVSVERCTTQTLSDVNFWSIFTCYFEQSIFSFYRNIHQTGRNTKNIRIETDELRWNHGAKVIPLSWQKKRGRIFFRAVSPLYFCSSQFIGEKQRVRVTPACARPTQTVRVGKSDRHCCYLQTGGKSGESRIFIIQGLLHVSVIFGVGFSRVCIL